MNKDEFGAFIAKARKKAGLTQRSLANKLHVTDKAVSKWERGLCYPDLTLMEGLASTLGLTMTELLCCKKQETMGDEPAVKSLLDISEDTVHRKTLTVRTLAVLVLAFALIFAVILCFSIVNYNTAYETFVMKECEGEDFYLYIDKGEHILRLRCKDESTYESIVADGKHGYIISCRWSRLNYKGTLLSCEDSDLSLGNPMNSEGSAIRLDDGLLGYKYVFSELVTIYPDPVQDNEYIRTYRYYYYRDGNSTLEQGEPIALLTVENCRRALALDYDGDDVVELIVHTRYVEEPYLLYELLDGQIVPRFMGNVSAEIQEIFENWNP